MTTELEDAEAQLRISEERTVRAYTERMIAVRLLAIYSGFPYGVGKDTNESWDDEWRNVVYIDLPSGQISWHIAPNDLHLFADFPPYTKGWDGTFKNRSTEFALSIKPSL